MTSLSRIRRPGARRAGRDDGQALVELALALPILLLLLMGIIQFGIMISDYSTLVDAARSGAQELSVGRGLSDPCDLAVKQAMTNTAGAFSVPASDFTPSFNSTADYCGTSSGCPFVYNTSCNSGGTLVQGDQATMSVSYPYTLSVMGLGVLHFTLRSSSSDAIQ
jgi:Flp pilus assembly protein TadG